MVDPAHLDLWRVFPWDESAREADRFSASHVPPPTGRGRFDLPRELSPTLYLAESPDHAVAELIQPWRGRRISPAHLVRAGHPLAMVRVKVDVSSEKIADLCEPEVLTDTGVAPDRSASRRREVTQPLARRIWEGGFTGLRWWSSFWGDWHTHVVFTARTRERLSFGEPEPLDVAHPAVAGAAGLLGIEVAG